MSHLGVIERFATGTYTLTRAGTGTYTSGRYVVASGTDSTIIACIQPVSGRDLQNLAEAQHGDEVKVIYTRTELLTRTPTTAPDTVTIDSEPWEVFRVERWEAWGETHYRAYVSRAVVP